jgi:hypothetical protein
VKYQGGRERGDVIKGRVSIHAPLGKRKLSVASASTAASVKEADAVKAQDRADRLLNDALDRADMECAQRHRLEILAREAKKGKVREAAARADERNRHVANEAMMRSTIVEMAVDERQG